MDISEAKNSVKSVENFLRKGYSKSQALFYAAQELELPLSTLRSRVDDGGSCERLGFSVNWSLSEGEPDYERILSSLQNENSILKRKITSLQKDVLDSEDIKEVIGGLASQTTNPPEWLLESGNSNPSQEVPVLMVGDWHGGEKVSLSETNGINEFNNEIMEKRVKRLVERTLDLCKNHAANNYSGLVLPLLGDFISGGIHPELSKTDEEEVIPSSLRVRDLLVGMIENFLAEFNQIYCPCTSGNHARNTHKPEYKRLVFKNFDWMIYQLLYRHFKNDPRVRFDIPESNEVLFKIFGYRFLLMHGDQLGVKGGDGLIGALGPIMRGALKVGRQSAAMGRDFDFLLAGHWHQTLNLPGIMINNTLKGYDEFSMKCLRAVPALPSQTLFFVHPKWGKTQYREIYLEDKGVIDKNWVSVFQ